MNEPQLPLKSLMDLRRSMKGILSIIEMYLSRFNPLCRDCFFNRGLVDACECGKKK
jgi:hypothetical protein